MGRFFTIVAALVSQVTGFITVMTAIVLFAPTSYGAESMTLPLAPMSQEELDLALKVSQAIDSSLLAFASSGKPEQIYKEIVDLLRHPEMKYYTLSTVEDRLRRLNTNVFLVAIPAPPSTRLQAIAPWFEGEIQFSLGVYVGTREEMLQRLQLLKIPSYEANLENLKHTGILASKPRR